MGYETAGRLLGVQVGAGALPIIYRQPPPARGRAAHDEPHPPDTKATMNKRQLIDDIRRFNNTARPEFLAQFDEEALRQYLQHLEEARQKHLRKGAFMARNSNLRMVS